MQVMILTFEARETAEYDATVFGSVDIFDAAGLAVSPRLRGDEDDDFADDDVEDVDDDDDEEFEDEFEDDDDFEDDDFDDDNDVEDPTPYR